MITISQSNYEDQVDDMAERLIAIAEQDVERDTAYSSVEDAIRDLACDVIYPHSWFARSKFGAGEYGQIIGHALEHVDDSVVDMKSHVEVDSLEILLRETARDLVEAHITQRALDQYRDSAVDSIVD